MCQLHAKGNSGGDYVIHNSRMSAYSGISTAGYSDNFGRAGYSNNSNRRMYS